MAHPTSTDEPFILELSLDKDSPAPLYSQIAAPLEEAILSGRLEPGQLIEDEVSMAKRLKVSRPTTRRALADLVSRGLLTRKRGAGTRVTPMHVRRPLALTSLNDDLIKAGFIPHTEVLSYTVRLADADDALALDCAEGTEIVDVTRRRTLEDRPLAILHNLLLSQTAPTVTQLSARGLYSCLEDRGIHPSSAQQNVGARAAEEDEAKLLGIPLGSAILTMERTAFDTNGKVIEFGTHIYNAELYSFHFTLNSSTGL